MSIFAKDPIFHFSVVTADHRWMIAASIEGRLTIMSPFVGDQDEVETICKAWNSREMERYKADSADYLSAAWKEGRLTLDQIIAKFGTGV